MSPPTNAELNRNREENCLQITTDMKYYRVGQTWIKRSLRPSEWQKEDGYMPIPLFSLERVLNEGACLRHLADKTNIPIPKLHACFEDDGAAYLITEYVEGVAMSWLDEGQREVVAKELRIHMKALSNLKHHIWGGPSGLVMPPYRIMQYSDGRSWKMKPRRENNLVFCHNDLSTNNVIVDPRTLKIKAIINWEYAGYYPQRFESAFFQRLGPSIALKGEVDDTEWLHDILSEERI
ncbi:hypothetical protein H634G_07036 [Metarhizium anisopliae BRIP 53293]|uniref:Aminoglycoside phosphotransferase domain-containing protein n=1 Tax=Metarhizium anisopliae BRIP 53293 TaxID=1291518 RepID=A0A0D9NTB5_METAN|nr:hypothetical protein H634G_07036 [Metarhizium anisopliae BRIP 53293]KJK94761.1 hypothetical protein H633G_01363 [Metarhizium anisopliae BRIP 53284]